MIETLIDFIKQDVFLSHLVRFALVLIVIWILARLIYWIENFIGRRLVKRTRTTLDDELLDVVASSSGKLVWVIGLFFAFKYAWAMIPELVYNYVDGFLYVVAVFIFAQLVNKLLQTVLDWYNARWGKTMHRRIQDEFGPLFRRVIFILVYLSALIIILKHFNQEISSLVVSLGVGSLAIALAAKDTLANMIAGFMIMTDRPFRLNDRIMLENGEKGDVYDIGLRSTKILTFDNTLIIVPNQQIVNEKVMNLSYPDPQIRVIVEVGVAYGSDLKKVKSIMEAICNAHPNILDTPPPAAYFLNFGDSSLDMRITCYVPKWGQQWQTAEDIRMAIYERFEAEGIEIPFPQRVITMQNTNQSE